MNRYFGLKVKILFFVLSLLGMATLYSAEKYYWENPKVLSSGEARFPVTINTTDFSYIFWQEVVPSKNQIWLSCRVYTDNKTYTENLKFAGPFQYSGEVPDIFSVTESNGRILVAVLSDKMKVSAFLSQDHCHNFSHTDITTNNYFIAPRVYTCQDGSFRLFASASENDSFYLYYAESKDGKNWSSFKPFAPGNQMRNPFVPYQINAFGGELVVFQAYYSSSVTGRLSYQLFSTFTSDGGSTWSAPALLTDQSSHPSNEKRNFANFQNQRPYVYNYGGKTYVVWERMESVSAAIWSAELTKTGITAKSALKISDKGNSNRAQLFEYNNQLYALWFDTRTGSEQIYMAQKAGNDWEEITVLENSNSNMFVSPLIVKKSGGKQLSFIWQQSTKSANNLAILLPDTTVSAPRLTPTSYREGKASRDKNVYIQVVFPDDSSGINGYSYTWGKDNYQQPPQRVQYFTNIKTINVQAPDDGYYNLLVRVQDKAGNWSDSAKIVYHRDLTPPQAPLPNDPVF